MSPAAESGMEFSAKRQAVILLIGVAVLRVAGAHVSLMQGVRGVMCNTVGFPSVI